MPPHTPATDRRRPRTDRLAAPPETTSYFQQARHKFAAGERRANPNRLVFTTAVGSALDPSNVRRAPRSSPTPPASDARTPHLLRHAAASLLSAAEVRLEDITDARGHRSVTVATDMYRHPLAFVRTGRPAAMTAPVEP